VRAAAIAYFFAIAAIGFLAVRAAHRLRVRYGHPYLSAWTLYVGFWSTLVLLAVVRYVLIAAFLPPSSQDLAGMAGMPLAVVATGAALYFLALFLGQIVRRPPSKIYRAAYVAACGLAVVLIVIRSEARPTAERELDIAISIVGLLLKNATAYGWMILTLVRSRTLDDRLERDGVRRVVYALCGGFLVFDLVFRDVLAPFGIYANDYVLSTLHIGLNIPALVVLGRVLDRQSRERPRPAVQANPAELLASLGVSAREIEVVELVMKGYANKEIADRLCISIDTVKKHIYNVYKKLGVQNRVQLTYFVQNRTPR
jgi:DNA-binding CsgD family transcriptional regulator